MTSGTDDRFILYVILLSQVSGKEFTEEVIGKHVRHIRNLDEQGKLVLCGPFVDHRGGMIVIRASSRDEAQRIAEADPFISEEFETYELRTLQQGCRENNFLLD